MVIKTKKYQLKPATYIKAGMSSIMLRYWWVWFVPVFILLIPIFYKPSLVWCISIAITLSILYILFWLIQLAGFTQMEQTKMFFQRLSYEIDSQKILIKFTPKQGTSINWNTIKSVVKKKNYFLFIIGKVQFIYLPYMLFKNEDEVKRINIILKRKKLLN